MKYIVIGLGNFGASLACRLAATGYEVIGVDNNMQKVEEMKQQITHAICMDATERAALSTLPLKDSDAVIVAIGEDFGTSVKITALLQELKHKRIIGRAFTPLHATVLKAIGVKEVVNPEQDFAEHFAKKLIGKE